MATRRSASGAKTAMGPGDRWRWSLLFVSLGALAIGLQTYLLQEFLVLLQGDETAVGLGLAAWFVGIACGALASRQCGGDTARIVAGGSASLLGLLGCAEVPCARFARSVIGAAPGELLALGPSLSLALLLFALPGACVGAAFVSLASVAAHVLGDASRAIGRLYVFEALGSLAAGLLISLVLVPHLEPTRGSAWLTGLALSAALPAALRGAIAGRRAIAGITVLAIGAAVSPITGRVERITESARFETLALGARFRDAKNTPYQHLAMGGAAPYVLYSNGALTASFPDPSADELLAHQLMLFAEHPSRVLSFGGIETGLLRFCLMHPVSSVDIVLLDAAATAFVGRVLTPEDRAALRDPRVRVIYEDPRRFLERSTASYSLVLSLASDPNTLLQARTTSVEFHRLVNARLATDGVYVSRFSAGANVQSGETGMLGASLYRTLREVFPVVRASPGPEGLFLAGKSPSGVTLDTTELERRFRQRTLQSETFVPELLPELLPAERVDAINRELERSRATVATATDDRPVSFQYALSVRQMIAGSAWAPLLQWTNRHPLGVVASALVPSAAILIAELLRHLGVRRRAHPAQPSAAFPQRAAWHATAVAGASGLASSLLLFVSFQTRVGALYSELGALSGLFMVGLAAGGYVVMRDRRPQPLFRAQLIGTILSAFIVVSLALATKLPSTRPVLWLLHIALLLGAGFGGGIVFPAASRELCHNASRKATGQVASSLELADYVGATVAALFSAVVLLPALGIVKCAGLLLGLQMTALGVTWLASNAARAPHHHPQNTTAP